MTRTPAHPVDARRRGGGHRIGARPCALALTATAGYVDIVGYLLLAHLFVANMSGNSVAMGMSAADGNWSETIRRGYPVLAFVAGLLLGGVVAEVGRRRWGSGRAVRATLGVEVALLAAFAAFGAAFGHDASSPLRQGTLVTLAAAGMGVQNVALRASGALGVYTTHVTGTLTQLADEAVRYGLWVYRRTSRPRRWGRVIRASPRHPAFRDVSFLLALWLVYVSGAAAGATLLPRLHVGATMLVPLTLLLAVLLLGCRPSAGAAHRLQQ